MALLSLLFNKPKKFKIQVPNSDTSERELLIIDAVNNINHQHSANPTDNPVELGADITDHVDIQRKVISFEGVVSEAPIKIEQAAVGNVAGAVGGVIGQRLGGVGGTVATAGLSALGGLLMNEQGNRVQEAFNALQDLMEKSQPVTIITGLRAYNNMVLTDFSPTESDRNGNSLVFNATFREIKIVRSKQVKLPKEFIDPATQASAGDVTNQGKKVASEIDEERGSSYLSDILGVGA